jgi:hypothetical protein
VVRAVGGAAVLAVLVWRLGSGPFLDGVRGLGTGPVLSVLAITSVTTVCCAWRWSVVARGLGMDLPVRAAIAAYYRSQLLNGVLPGGVLGDVHRGVRQGRDTGDIGRGLRAVAWERSAGQVVQAVVASVVLLTLASPARSAMPLVVVSAVVGTVLVALALRALSRRPSWTPARALRAAAADIRQGLLASSAWPRVGLASVVVVVGHTATFLIAAHAVGVAASPARLLPLALVVLLAAAVPLNVLGWGPREGVAAWVFAAAGLGAGPGVATATAFGLLGLVATLPGALVLAVDRLPRAAGAATGVYNAGQPPDAWVLVRDRREGAAHG